MTPFEPQGPQGGQLGGGGPEIPEGRGWGRGSQGPYNPIPRDDTPQAPQMKHLDLTLSHTKVQGSSDGSYSPSDDLTTYVGKDQYGREWHWSHRKYMDPEDWESWEISYVDKNGLWHGYREKDGNFYDTWTDEYGREWRSTEDAQDKTSLGYTDKDGLWHDTFEADGVWNDNWTDKNGTRWESFYDENGQHHVGYRDADGGWHDVDPISGAELNLEHHAERLPGLEPLYDEQAASAPAHAKGGLPKLVEEPAPAPTLAPLQPDPDPDVQENLAKDYGLAGLEEKPPVE